ncbi:hypothetical protein KVR01_010474 [Diaporthe batatas]|uniref:uncharacterized protein n=1 Tax=Diaporthe batatas TaxID=748121 RepID=UPI001D04D9B4|nr:uncharacterized protein KVR01_010474 [Diaporthe batatas]KAG8159837.1 hypothetical protein KVR01_010474 [Diaporthe batatas]
MAPTLPRAPLRSLSSTILLPSATASKTAPPTAAATLRTFSTTQARRDVDIPPESPRFINLPELPQSSEDKLPPVKGVLPVPREVFHRRNNGSHKIQADFVEHTAPRSRAEAAGEPPRSDRDAWRRRLAESRRKALAAGIGGLWARKNTREGRARQRAESHRQRNLAAANAPEGLDDVFTRGTVPQATLETRVARDPLYRERQLESQARTAALQQARSEARKDAIQRLYVEAGRFIVSEDQLAQRVEEIFSDGYFKGTGVWQGKTLAENIWDKHGSPTPVRHLFAAMKGTSRSVVDGARETGIQFTTHRQKMVAGELTGGAVSAGGDGKR